MLSFTDRTETTAPIEEVWKLLVDPGRYPQWWAGIARVTEAESGGEAFTLYHPDDPELPWPQRIENGDSGSLVVSCLTSDMRYRWQLDEAGAHTTIGVEVEIPPDWAEHLESQRALISRSLRNLALLSER